MKTYYLFSKNKKMGSKLISWASSLLLKDMKVVPSHVAVLVQLDNVTEQFVLESVLSSGVRIVPYKTWLQINEECYKIEFKSKVNMFSVLDSIWNKKYDWPGIGFFAWCFFKYFLYKDRFNKKNKWHSKNK